MPGRPIARPWRLEPASPWRRCARRRSPARPSRPCPPPSSSDPWPGSARPSTGVTPASAAPPRRIPHGPLLLLFEEHERRSDLTALEPATATLDAILASPLRASDGGFFREALEADWSRPVEERTLADNALLLRALVAAYEATGRSSYAEAAAGLAGFLTTRLADEWGGFRHALAGGPSAERRDDRVFAFANGLAVSALARGGRVLGRTEDVTAAAQAAERVLARLGPALTLSRFAQGSDRRGSALLVDHAFLAEGMLDLHEATGWHAVARRGAALVDAAIARYGGERRRVLRVGGRWRGAAGAAAGRL